MEIVSTESKRGKKAPELYDMHHGILIFNREGEIYWRKPGHDISRREIVNHLEGVLKQEQ